MVQIDGVNTSKLIIKFNDLDTDGFSISKIYGIWNGFKNTKQNQLFSGKYKQLNSYVEITFPISLDKYNAKHILDVIYSQPNVEFAIFEPKIEDAFVSNSKLKVNSKKIAPSYERLQDYLDPAPRGVDARFAWTIPGGTGKNVKFIDIETGIYDQHDDLKPLFWQDKNSKQVVQHGIAVVGIIKSKNDGIGTTGIAYDSEGGFISRSAFSDQPDYHSNVAKSIETALDQLEQGDVLILEMHSTGPTRTFIPVEYWQPIFDILKVAESKGIYCVAAGGNGNTNLDSSAFNNAFNTQYRNSNCVLVGASTHVASNVGNRISFSNYGSRIDAHAFGEYVVTTGYGDLFFSDTSSYTNTFGGTSSATPIVAGVVVALSSIAKENGKYIPIPILRQALRATGTKQKVETQSERIGNLPDIRELYDVLGEYMRP